MIACTQPGCGGTIAADGYCDTCGAPAAAAPAPAPVAAPVATPPLARPGGVPRPVPPTSAGLPPLPSPGTTPGTMPGPANGEEAAASARVSTSQRLESSPIGSARVGSGRTRVLGAGSRRAPRLGAGITTIPAAPIADPLSTVMKVPEVAESKRFCSVCQSEVGRTRGDRPGRTQGFCPKCGSSFDFDPKLRPGDLVGGQYEVVGCLAHGGLGWIYLARDRNVSDRWVVLKGLLNAGDRDAYAAAIAERQFLAEVEHPLIVEIYNFVLHDGQGYIVMEWVGGKSLKQLLKERRDANGGVHDPIPLDQAIAFVVEILPAFSYLHSLGLLYCDFKPDNVIQQGDALKLIDLGGVRRMDDEESAIYGTVGFQAPEVATVGPSIASDIFTIGRTLVVLAMEFRGYQGAYATTLPPVEDVPLFQHYDSFHRLVLRACAPEPADRFASADELREQLIGVLREVVATQQGQRPAQHSTPSALFDAPAVAGDALDWRELPRLRVDGHDPAAAWLATVSVADPKERLRVLDTAPEVTREVQLAAIASVIEAGEAARADAAIARVLAEDPWEWRAVWYQGLAALARGDHANATAAFNTVYGQVPGELAPKLGLALACERGGQPDVAERLYTVCLAGDANYTAPAAFGIARLRAARGDTAGAIAALDAVPPTSRAFVDARRGRAALLTNSPLGLPALAEAMASVESITLEPVEREQLVVEVLQRALVQVQQGAPSPDLLIAGVPAEERALRKGIEQSYRRLATLTDDRDERIALVDAANRVRPRTLT